MANVRLFYGAVHSVVQLNSLPVYVLLVNRTINMMLGVTLARRDGKWQIPNTPGSQNLLGMEIRVRDMSVVGDQMAVQTLLVYLSTRCYSAYKFLSQEVTRCHSESISFFFFTFCRTFTNSRLMLIRLLLQLLKTKTYDNGYVC
jgi:hypothetical protein